jgi:streptogramin lyase
MPALLESHLFYQREEPKMYCILVRLPAASLVVMAVALAFLATGGFGLGTADADEFATRTYTLDADFDEGSAINVVHTIVPDQLQLDDTTKAFPFIWVAASQRGTIVKIDTESGDILGEYQSAPDGRGLNPSRTTVDKSGNVWAGNRAESEGGNGSVVHVGLPENGQCEDRNGNGLIDTSSGLGDIMAWPNTGGVDDDGGVDTAEDECIIHYVRVTGTRTRHVSVDENNDLWVGGLGDKDFEKVDGGTGEPVPGTQFNLGCGGYGGLIDANGILWSARSPILRFDTNTMTGECLNTVPSAYGMGLDRNTGHVWVSQLGGSDRVHELDPADGSVLHTYPQGLDGAQGLVVDGDSHVWVAQIFGSRVLHLAPDTANPGQHLEVGKVSGFNGTTGVAVDANGKIWAAEIDGNSASRIDPAAGPVGGGGYPLGEIDLTVDLGEGAGPYNYSDMTGAVLIGAPDNGTWTVDYDSGIEGAEWGKVSWTANVKGDSSLAVSASSSADGVTYGPAEAVTDGADLTVADGQYLRVSVSFSRASTGGSPILFDLTVSTVGEPEPTPVPTPSPTPSPTAVAEEVQEPAALPDSGGEPAEGGTVALPWLAAIAGAVAVMTGGGLWFAHQRRRVR